ncbi:Clavaminate synthase-like protein, partial [Crassisporium funariophilum]
MANDFTQSIRWLSKEYRELNGNSLQILDQPPSPLEFSRLIHISRPVIIKGLDLPALRRWNDGYLIEKMGNRQISVAVTPNGRADAITRGPEDKLYFVEPCVEKMSMEDLCTRLNDHSLEGNDSDILYLQSQNGNLFPTASFDEPEGVSLSEFEPLTSDVLEEIPWCSKALGQKPDAVNIWIGNERSTTSIHNDPYENIYTVIRGQKHFFLLPPLDAWCLKERYYPHAVYKRLSSRVLDICPSQDISDVRWSSITNPELPHILPDEVCPIRVTLLPGETLYLPVGWWHYVRQSGTTIALNWWYDAELRGMTWALLNFLRNPREVPLVENGDELTGESTDEM